MSGPKELPSTGEYPQRLALLQEQMQALALDSLIVSGPENLYYLTGLSLNFGVPQYLIVQRDRGPRLVVYVTEAYNAEHFTSVEDFVTYKPGEDPLVVIRKLISQGNAAGGRIGVQKNTISAEDYERLCGLLAEAEFVDSSGLVERLRMIKSAAEIAYMREAARAVEAATRAGIAAIEEGKTENEIAAAVYHASILAGSEHMSSTNFIISGERSVIPHGTWAGRKIARGDIVFLENSCRVKGYIVPLLRTVILGQPSDAVARSAEAVIMAREHTLAALRPGITSGEVQRTCERVFEKMGYGAHFRHRAGYTIGLQWPETYAMSIQPDDPRPLQPGMVFHLVPHLEFYDEKYVVACGEVALITEDGHEVLTHFEPKLFVV